MEAKYSTRACSRSLKLQYLGLVVLPQVIWLLSTSSGVISMCESCSNYGTEVRQWVTPEGEPLSSRHSDKPTAHHSNSTPHSHSLYSDPNVSRLCACAASESLNSEMGAVFDALQSDTDPNGGWHIPHILPDLSGPCNIKKIHTSLPQLDFLEKFAYREPVILTGMSDQSDYGHEVIIVATANTHSYQKVEMTLCEYVDRIMKPQTFDSFGNETWYYFGDNDRNGWDSLFSLYQLPPVDLPDSEPVLSFGLAGPGTGVPFHIHGPTFAETIYGRKRWFLYPPDHQPDFHPDITTLQWVVHTYPSLEDKPLECTLQPGEIIYFPDRWWHATLNLDAAVFMSTFYSQS